MLIPVRCLSPFLFLTHNLHSVPKLKTKVAIRVSNNLVDGYKPKPIVELFQRLNPLHQLEQKATYLTGLIKPFFTLRFQRPIFGVGGFVSFGQTGIPLKVVSLVKRRPRILIDALTHHPRNDAQLLIQCRQFGIDGIAVGERRTGRSPRRR